LGAQIESAPDIEIFHARVCAAYQEQHFADARRLFKRLAGLCNDVGLLAEEYDSVAGGLVGNFPQAFSHTDMPRRARACSL
jgi:GH15 family glucan-1,4-alpha-glucosidase